MDRLLRWMECALCLENTIEFNIYCQRGHSFCTSCCNRLDSACPICRFHPILGSIKDQSRRRIISEYYDDFRQDLRSAKTMECDVLDRDAIWREGRIVKQDGASVKIHFYGWDDRWDEWHSLTIDQIRPLHSMVTDWFSLLSVSDKIEFRIAISGQPIRWHMGTLVLIDTSRSFCHIRRQTDDKLFKIKWSKHHIANLGTHRSNKMDKKKKIK